MRNMKSLDRQIDHSVCFGASCFFFVGCLHGWLWYVFEASVFCVTVYGMFASAHASYPLLNTKSASDARVFNPIICAVTARTFEPLTVDRRDTRALAPSVSVVVVTRLPQRDSWMKYARSRPTRATLMEPSNEQLIMFVCPVQRDDD